MPYTLTLANDADRRLIVDALRTASAQRLRVARGAGREVANAKRSGADVRSAAVRVAMVLAEADTLEQLAGELEAAEDVPVLRPTDGWTDDQLEAAVGANADTIAALRSELTGDDGTSPEAQAIAELAGLEPTILAEDPVTGATAEDTVGDVEEVLTDAK